MGWLSVLRRGVSKRLSRRVEIGEPIEDRNPIKDASNEKISRVYKYGKLTCNANTKSEARAVFKSTLGLKRLPIGAVVERIR